MLLVQELTLVAIILQIVFFVVGIIFALFFFTAIAAISALSTGTTVTIVQNGTTFTGFCPFTGGIQIGSGCSKFSFWNLCIVLCNWISHFDYLDLLRLLFDLQKPFF